MPINLSRNILMRTSLGLAMAWIALGFGLSSSSLAAGNQQLLPLERLTVGPYDNFQASVDSEAKYLYYTRSENLSSQVMRLDLKSKISQAVTGVDADAKAPAPSPDSRFLAIHFFKQDAKGDICLLDLKTKDQDILCISEPRLADHSPVWITNDKLGYVTSSDTGLESSLKIYDLNTKKTTVILKGEIYAPDLAPDGKTMVYRSKKNELILLDIASRRPLRTIYVGLPGVTGPAKFSADGVFLYITQYMIDSNRDLQLDSRDAAAVFRFNLKSDSPYPPEQLTSLQQNCSYPNPAKDALYMTCALEGSLDVYRGALGGSVPSTWSAKDLNEAHHVSRSYFDRILFLNQLESRFGAISEQEFMERAMQNFSFAGEYLTALFYAQKLAALQPSDAKLKAYSILFASFARWEVLPQKQNLGAYAQLIEKKRRELKALKPGSTQRLTEIYLDLFANQADTAMAKAASFEPDTELDIFLLLRLHVLAGRSPGELRKFLADRVLKKTMIEENKLFYLSLWLEALPVNEDPRPLIADLKAKVSGSSSSVELLDNEVDLYNVVRGKSEDEITVHYHRIADRVNRIKDAYYPMRLLFNRAIIVFYKGKKSREMSSVISLWLSFLNKNSKEFPFAIEALRQNSLDLAYQFYNSKTDDRQFALGSFNNSIRSSDDLESHYQHALLSFANWEKVQKLYSNMVRQGLIKPESMAFINALKTILDRMDQPSKEEFEKAIGTIEGIDDLHVGIGMKYLFLGYLYHRQLELTVKGFTYDHDLADKAHRAYLFAIDGAWNNDRILAAALQNLASLHSTLRNFTLASEFLIKRDEIPYTSAAEQLACLWLKARAFYLSYRLKEAYEAITAALALQPEPRAAFLERAAFYAWNAGNFEEAVGHYQAYSQESPQWNYPAHKLGYAYALKGAGKAEQSHKTLIELIESLKGQSDGLEGEPPHLIFQPIKARFLAYGLISQNNALPGLARIEALESRLKLYPKIIDNAKTLHFQEEVLGDQQIKEAEDLVRLYAENRQPELAGAWASKAMELLSAYAEETSYLSQSTLSALKNLWLTAFDFPIAEGPWRLSSKALAEKAEKECLDQKDLSSIVRRKCVELKLIETAFSRQKPMSRAEFIAQSDSILKSAKVSDFAKDSADFYQGLVVYRNQITQSLP